MRQINRVYVEKDCKCSDIEFFTINENEALRQQEEEMLLKNGIFEDNDDKTKLFRFFSAGNYRISPLINTDLLKNGMTFLCTDAALNILKKYIHGGLTNLKIEKIDFTWKQLSYFDGSIKINEGSEHQNVDLKEIPIQSESDLFIEQ